MVLRMVHCWVDLTVYLLDIEKVQRLVVTMVAGMAVELDELKTVLTVAKKVALRVVGMVAQ
jgi:hypothetical protein